MVDRLGSSACSFAVLWEITHGNLMGYVLSIHIYIYILGKWDFTSNYGNIPWDYHFYTMGIYHGIIYIYHILINIGMNLGKFDHDLTVTSL